MLAGKGTYGQPVELTWQGLPGRLVVGRYCSIARGVEVLLDGEHYTDRVTTYPFSMFPEQWPAAKGIEGRPFSKGDITIGNDVWLGYSAKLLSGVSVGDGAVVGAFSVVTRDVEPYAIVGGAPARLLRYRFEPEVVQRLLRLQWWCWSDSLLSDYLPLLLGTDMAAFLERAEADPRCAPTMGG